MKDKRRHFFRQLLREAFSREIQSLFLLVSSIVIVSTIFYTNVESWRALDSFYFSVMTLTTVGYGDLAPVTDAGKIFTIILVLGGLGVVLTFLQMLAKEQVKEPLLERIINYVNERISSK